MPLKTSKVEQVWLAQISRVHGHQGTKPDLAAGGVRPPLVELFLTWARFKPSGLPNELGDDGILHRTGKASQAACATKAKGRHTHKSSAAVSGIVADLS
jgi:hypothetical protein